MFRSRHSGNHNLPVNPAPSSQVVPLPSPAFRYEHSVQSESVASSFWPMTDHFSFIMGSMFVPVRHLRHQPSPILYQPITQTLHQVHTFMQDSDNQRRTGLTK